MADMKKLVENFFLEEDAKKGLVVDANALENIIKQTSENIKQTKSVQQENTVSIEEFEKLILEYAKLFEAPRISNIPAESKSSLDFIMKIMPRFEFSQKETGDIGSEERALLINYFGKEVANANTFKDKIQVINNIVKSQEEKLKGIEAFRKLMILKILRNLIYNFYSSPSGYNFEAIFAALMGGQQFQPQEGGFIDVVVGGRHHQLKMISRTRDLEIPIVSIKRFLDIPYIPKEQYSKKEELAALEKANLQKEIVLVVGLKGDKGEIKFFETVIPAEEIFNKLKVAVENNEKNIFIKTKEYSKNFIGKLDVSDKELLALSKQLESTMVLVLKNVSELIDNINAFYLNNVTKAAEKGIQNATIVSAELSTEIKK